MAFTAIDANTIQVGDPITADILSLIKSNFDDHESRINSLAVATSSIFIVNEQLSFIGYNASNPNVFYFKARQNMSVNDFRAQLFSKQGITSGTLSFDLEKSVDTDDANFSSILTADLSFNFATASDYDEAVASIDSGLNSISTGDVLRIKVTSVPINTFSAYFSGNVLISVGAQ